MSVELFAAGASLLSGFLGSKKQDKANKAALGLNREQFNRLQHHSISDRVADAKRAGIHPLFALGASVGSPSVSPFVPNTGNYMGDGIERATSALSRGATSKSQKAIAATQLENQTQVSQSQVKLNEAQAQLALSQAKRQEIEAHSQGRDLITLTGHPGPLGRPAPVIKNRDGTFASPAKPKTVGPSPRKLRPGKKKADGPMPAMVDVRMPDGRIVQMFNPEAGMDEMSSPNMQRYAWEMMLNGLPNAIKDWWSGGHNMRPKRGTPQYQQWLKHYYKRQR